MTILSKTDIENLIKTRAPSISYAKSKRSASEHCTNFSQVFVNCIAQNFICCSNCDELLAWKSGDGSTNLKKTIKAAAEFRAVDNRPFQIVQGQEFFVNIDKEAHEKYVKDDFERVTTDEIVDDFESMDIYSNLSHYQLLDIVDTSLRSKVFQRGKI
ncbi:unnamed protein product [Adineta steineri]|uniref:Uncharacterized protein n=1 Tax=Adineta steineri TaxID=433720 RepID=A0A819TPX8_9BILA|nr:unnamed protein product [Adineta steineri]CAF4081360.1 unnamed protein product [Adineta steineri]CAF4091466.1 unnamed protein product [Adineta steineri]